MKYSRQILLLMCLAGLICPWIFGQLPLQVERDGAHLRVSAPRLHILQGKSLEQLQNGASLTFAFELTLAPDQKSAPLVRLQERFSFSFDLWEERFAVVQTGPAGRSASHLTAAAAEAWCVDTMKVALPQLNPDKTFMLRLECWEAVGEAGSGGENGATLTLAGLVDVFSRKGRNPQPHWLAIAGPLRLTDIMEKKKPKT
jgi:hypothetical protein